MKLHKYDTITQVYPSRKCKFTFTPKAVAVDGQHFIIMGMIQKLIYGLWNGTCDIDGEIIDIKNVLGTVEHVNARW